jgi:hypothetical protein
MDTPSYSEPKLCGGAVTVSFSKYLPSQAMHFLQRSTHFSKMRCRPLVTSKFLVSGLLYMVRKSQKLHRAKSELNSVFGLEKVDRWNTIRTLATQSRSHPMRFLGLSNHGKARNFEVIDGLQHVFEKWVERCKKGIACQRRYFEKETVTAPSQSSDSE